MMEWTGHPPLRTSDPRIMNLPTPLSTSLILIYLHLCTCTSCDSYDSPVQLFFFTGLQCQYDNQCGSNPCHSRAVCETSPINGTYVCSCHTGWNGTDCTVDIDECRESKSSATFGFLCPMVI